MPWQKADQPPENVLLCNNTATAQPHDRILALELFRLREGYDFHVPTDFEEDVCAAVQAGDKERLVRRLQASAPGRIGIMSSNALQQSRYVFITFITLVNRAAVRGSLPQETAFSLSDVYCQRMDMLTDDSSIQKLLFTIFLQYPSQSYFTQIFKKYTGTTPQIYRDLPKPN